MPTRWVVLALAAWTAANVAMLVVGLSVRPKKPAVRIERITIEPVVEDGAR